MAVNLLDLPLELLNGIFLSMNDKSLLKMREVCHITKSITETTAINRTKDSKSTGLKLERKLNKIDVTFEFSVGMQNLWEEECHSILPAKLYFASIMNHLQIADVDYNSEGIFMRLTQSETVSFFDRLAPLIGKVKCKSLMLHPPTIEMLSLTSKLFEAEAAPELKFLINNTNQLKLEGNDALNLLHNVGSTVASVCFEVPPSAEFLEKLADSVDALAISTGSNVNDVFNGDTHRVASLSYCILMRRCSYLDLVGVSTAIEEYEAGLLSYALFFGVNIIPKVYLRARTLERKCGSRTNSARKHTFTVSKERKSGRRFNVIEMRHEEMDRRYW